jgi:hypothetical protein
MRTIVITKQKYAANVKDKVDPRTGLEGPEGE